MAVSPSPNDLTYPQMVTMLDLPKLMVPSALTSQMVIWTDELSLGVINLSV